jgi:hypothetical protein
MSAALTSTRFLILNLEFLVEAESALLISTKN